MKHVVLPVPDLPIVIVSEESEIRAVCWGVSANLKFGRESSRFVIFLPDRYVSKNSAMFFSVAKFLTDWVEDLEEVCWDVRWM